MNSVTRILVLFCVLGFVVPAFAKDSKPVTLAAKSSVKPAPIRTGKPVDRTVKNLIKSYEKGKAFDASFRTLVALGPNAVPALLKCSRDEKLEDHQRWTAIRAIGRINDPSAIVELRKILQDPHPVMRMAALRALSDMGAKGVVDEVMKVAKKDDAMLVRNEAIQFLGKVKATQAVPLFEETFQDRRNFIKGQSLFIRRQVVVSLGEMQTRQAAPLLIRALDDRDETIPLAAIHSLRRVTGLKFEADTVGVARKQWKDWWAKEARRMPQQKI